MSYQIDLDVFNGPMDLLLYLISREEVDIHEILLSRIVDQYLEYLDQLKERNVNVTSDFVVMASTLILLKSKVLLPTELIDLEEEIDQQDDLIQHLLEYKKVKMLSRQLREKLEYTATLVPRPHLADKPMDDSVAYEDLNLWDIIRAFSKIVKETQLDRSFQVIHSEKPLSHYISNILKKLTGREHVDFEELFLEEKNRSEAVCFFIGLLELVKRNIATVNLDENETRFGVCLEIDEKELDAMKVDGEYQLTLLLEAELSEGEEFPESEETPETPEASDSDEPEALPVESEIRDSVIRDSVMKPPVPAKPAPEEGAAELGGAF